MSFTRRNHHTCQVSLSSWVKKKKNIVIKYSMLKIGLIDRVDGVNSIKYDPSRHQNTKQRIAVAYVRRSATAALHLRPDPTPL